MSSQGYGGSPIKGDRELGLERRESVQMLTTGGVRCLSGREFKYERNELSGPLVYRLSDRAVPGSYALRDKS